MLVIGEAPAHCVLCGYEHLRWVHSDRVRPYWSCERCQLVQVPSAYWCSAEQARAHYDHHDTDVYSVGHRNFLQRTVNPLLQTCPPPAQGLDFGSGPAPTLATMLREQGYQVALYDEHYALDAKVLQDQYEFITSTEVLEHLETPGYWLDRIWACLQPGGVLVIQSKRVLSDQHLLNWHYLRDPTHIIFFRIATWQWLARRWQTPVHLSAQDVVWLRKPERTQSNSMRSSK